MEVKFKPIESIEDLQFVRKMRNQFRDKFIYQEEVSEAEHLKWFQNLTYDFYIMWVNTEDISQREIKLWRRAGCFGQEHLSNGRLELHNNMIDEPFQGAHLFRKIVEFAEQKLFVQEKGFTAQVVPDNQHMIDVYKHYGFHIEYITMVKNKSSNFSLSA